MPTLVFLQIFHAWQKIRREVTKVKYLRVSQSTKLHAALTAILRAPPQNKRGHKTKAKLKNLGQFHKFSTMSCPDLQTVTACNNVAAISSPFRKATPIVNSTSTAVIEVGGAGSNWSPASSTHFCISTPCRNSDQHRIQRRRSSVHEATVTLNIYAAKVCLRLANNSPPPLFPSPPYSENNSPIQIKRSSRSRSKSLTPYYSEEGEEESIYENQRFRNRQLTMQCCLYFWNVTDFFCIFDF